MFPRLTIDLKRIRSNTDRMMEACRRQGVEVMGVTKGVCGDVEVARVFVEGGVAAIGDARLDNLSSLRMAGLGVPLWLIRSPSPREVPSTVAVADGSLQGDLEVVEEVLAHQERAGCQDRAADGLRRRVVEPLPRPVPSSMRPFNTPSRSRPS